MVDIHQRKFLIAIPYNSAPFGIRLDWSRLQRRLVFYYWFKGKVNSWVL